MATSVRESLADLSKQVVKLRDKDGKAWHEIAGETGESAGKCMLAYEFAQVPPSETVTARNDTEMAKKIVQMRDKEKLSWGRISARTDLPESRARTLFESVKGSDASKGDRIGKGGRYPGSNGTPAKKAATTKKATGSTRATKKSAPAKKAPATKKAVAKKAPATKKAATKKAAGKKAASGGDSGGSSSAHPLNDLGFDELAERLEGKTILVAPLMKGGKDRMFKVKAVKSLEDGTMGFSTEDQPNNNVKVANIRKISA